MSGRREVPVRRASDVRQPSAEQIEGAAARLSRTEREVLRLGAAEGLDNAQIGERLGLPARKVEHILARALCKLDRALERLDKLWWQFW